MNRNQQLARTLFALGIVGFGILALVDGHFALDWQPVPAWIPWREGFPYASGIIMLGSGAGLLFTRTTRLSARILLPYLLIWLLLRVPALATAPLTVVGWESAGEVAVLVAGGWILFARLAELRDGSKLQFATGENGRRIARILFALALAAFGLSHFAYVGHTAELVPKWLPSPTGWVYLTGAGHIAAGIGVLFSIYPRFAAMMEAAMLGVFTLLVWVPALLATPTIPSNWSEFLTSWAVTAGAWVVAESITRKDSAKQKV
ncbi:MAG TPA: DoxX family membrane protein [Gemmatimonadaceae bacterium]